MILITGATGIVGSQVAIKLLQKSSQVRLLVRKTSDREAINQLLQFHNVEDTFEYVDGDLNDPLSLDSALEGINHVYHCAAMVHFGTGKNEELFKVNVLGTKNLVDLCLLKGIKVCYLSSTAAVGSEVIEGKIREHSQWEDSVGRSDYSMSKREAELEVFRAIEEGLDAVVLNPCLIIGPGNWGNSSTSILLTAMKGLTFYPPGANAFVDARDVAEIAISLMGSPEHIKGRHLLIGENMGFGDFFKMACSVAGSKAPSIRLSKKVVQAAGLVIRAFEKARLWPFKVNSSSLDSACKVTVFANDKILSMGQVFRPIEESVRYSLDVYTSAKTTASSFS